MYLRPVGTAINVMGNFFLVNITKIGYKVSLIERQSIIYIDTHIYKLVIKIISVPKSTFTLSTK